MNQVEDKMRKLIYKDFVYLDCWNICFTKKILKNGRYDASKWRCLFVRYQKQTSKSFDAYKNILTYLKLKTVSISIVTYVNVTQFVCLFRKEERTSSQYPSCARIFE